MSTSSAFPNFPLAQPPAWLMQEVQQRLVLLLNHVLQQEPQAVERLIRKKGQVVLIECAPMTMKLLVTGAGLLDLADAEAKPDLSMKVQDHHPLELVKILLRGDKPRMEIAGDVMLAAEVNWLVDHLRWDVEEDLARIIGDVPAHSLMQAARGLGDALKKFVSLRSASSQDSKPAA